MWKSPLFAEFLGTFFVILSGCGAIILNFSPLIVSLAFGSTVAMFILIFRKTSGAHFNPVVTLTFYLLNKITLQKSILFICMQFVGALLAMFILSCFRPHLSSYGSTHFNISTAFAFILETLFTFSLIMTILLSAANPSAPTPRAAFLIGLCVALCAYFGGPLSGASMNPARSLAPAMIEFNLQQQWLYIMAPSIAAFISAKAFTLLKGKV